MTHKQTAVVSALESQFHHNKVIHANNFLEPRSVADLQHSCMQLSLWDDISFCEIIPGSFLQILCFWERKNRWCIRLQMQKSGVHVCVTRFFIVRITKITSLNKNWRLKSPYPARFFVKHGTIKYRLIQTNTKNRHT